MKKILLFLFVLLTGFSFKANALNDIGSNLSYMCVGPNTYLVTYSHYSFNASSNFYGPLLEIRGCNFAKIAPMQVKSTRIGGMVPGQSGLSPYYICEMTGTVTFNAAEATCKDWVINLKQGLRISSSNLIPAIGVFDLYTEAYLKLDTNINNSSPIFDSQNEPVLLAAPYQPVTLCVGAYDPEGDSLVYRAVAPLIYTNQPINGTVNTYKNIGTTALNPYPQPPYSNPGNPQFAAFPATSHYSPTWPLLSYTANWSSGQQVCIVVPYFDLNSTNGSLSFTPMLYDTIGVNNYYVVAFQVDEYRTINGIATKIGSVRRETYIKISAPGTNENPSISTMRINNVPVQHNTGFAIKPGSTITLQVDGFDNNAADSVFLASNATAALPGSTFIVNSARRQTGTLTWTPTTSQVRSQPYFLRIWVKDNASPLPGRHVETIAVRVSNSVTGVKAEHAINSDEFVAYPNPFTETINFRISSQTRAESILIYNLLGQQIDEIQLKTVSIGEQKVQWQNANKHAAGTYIARLIAEDKTIQTLKFTKLQ